MTLHRSQTGATLFEIMLGLGALAMVYFSLMGATDRFVSSSLSSLAQHLFSRSR